MTTVIFGEYEWDADKARSNMLKHGIGFPEAIRAFADPLALDLGDLRDPERFVLLGMVPPARVLYVVYSERIATGRTRIISARKASRHEKKIYEDR